MNKDIINQIKSQVAEQELIAKIVRDSEAEMVAIKKKMKDAISNRKKTVEGGNENFIRDLTKSELSTVYPEIMTLLSKWSKNYKDYISKESCIRKHAIQLKEIHLKVKEQGEILKKKGLLTIKNMPKEEENELSKSMESMTKTRPPSLPSDELVEEVKRLWEQVGQNMEHLQSLPPNTMSKEELEEIISAKIQAVLRLIVQFYEAFPRTERDEEVEKNIKELDKIKKEIEAIKPNFQKRYKKSMDLLVKKSLAKIAEIRFEFNDYEEYEEDFIGDPDLGIETMDRIFKQTEEWGGDYPSYQRNKELDKHAKEVKGLQMKIKEERAELVLLKNNKAVKLLPEIKERLRDFVKEKKVLETSNASRKELFKQAISLSEKIQFSQQDLDDLVSQYIDPNPDLFAHLKEEIDFLERRLEAERLALREIFLANTPESYEYIPAPKLTANKKNKTLFKKYKQFLALSKQVNVQKSLEKRRQKLIAIIQSIRDWIKTYEQLIKDGEGLSQIDVDAFEIYKRGLALYEKKLKETGKQIINNDNYFEVKEAYEQYLKAKDDDDQDKVLKIANTFGEELKKWKDNHKPEDNFENYKKNIELNNLRIEIRRYLDAMDLTSNQNSLKLATYNKDNDELSKKIIKLDKELAKKYDVRKLRLLEETIEAWRLYVLDFSQNKEIVAFVQTLELIEQGNLKHLQEKRENTILNKSLHELYPKIGTGFKISLEHSKESKNAKDPYIKNKAYEAIFEQIDKTYKVISVWLSTYDKLLTEYETQKQAAPFVKMFSKKKKKIHEIKGKMEVFVKKQTHYDISNNPLHKLYKEIIKRRDAYQDTQEGDSLKLQAKKFKELTEAEDLINDWLKKKDTYAKHTDEIKKFYEHILKEKEKRPKQKRFEDALFDKVQQFFKKEIKDKQPEPSLAGNIKKLNYLIDVWEKQTPNPDEKKAKKILEYQTYLAVLSSTPVLSINNEFKGIEKKHTEVNAEIARQTNALKDEAIKLKIRDQKMALKKIADNEFILHKKVLHKIAKGKHDLVENLRKDFSLTLDKIEKIELTIIEIIDVHYNNSYKKNREKEKFAFAGLGPSDMDYREVALFSEQQKNQMRLSLETAFDRFREVMKVTNNYNKAFRMIEHIPVSMLTDDYVKELDRWREVEAAFEEEAKKKAKGISMLTKTDGYLKKTEGFLKKPIKVGNKMKKDGKDNTAMLKLFTNSTDTTDTSLKIGRLAMDIAVAIDTKGLAYDEQKLILTGLQISSSALKAADKFTSDKLLKEAMDNTNTYLKGLANKIKANSRQIEQESSFETDKEDMANAEKLINSYVAIGITVQKTVEVFDAYKVLIKNIVPTVTISFNVATIYKKFKGLWLTNRELLKKAQREDPKYMPSLQQDHKVLGKKIIEQSINTASSILALVTFSLASKVLSYGNKSVFTSINQADIYKAKKLKAKAKAGDRQAQVEVFRYSAKYAKMFLAIGALKDPPDKIAREFLINRGITEADLERKEMSASVLRKYLLKISEEVEEDKTYLDQAATYYNKFAETVHLRDKLYKKFWKALEGNDYKSITEHFPRQDILEYIESTHKVYKKEDWSSFATFKSTLKKNKQQLKDIKEILDTYKKELEDKEMDCIYDLKNSRTAFIKNPTTDLENSLNKFEKRLSLIRQEMQNVETLLKPMA